MNVEQILYFLNQQLELGNITNDTEVRMQTQSNYPLENYLAGVTTKRKIEEQEAEDKGDREDVPDEIDLPAEKNVVYIVEGSQVGYGDRAAWATAETQF